MSRLKQRMNSFINAELNYNRKKGAPKKEFSKELNAACRANDIQYFTDLKTDAIKHLGESFMFTVISIGICHKIDKKYYE
jgi:hypothetical protein